ncbi:YhgE/Pip domain-containing protein [Halobacillus massiliensis]|uniref:YhgE/Pip domain-containing protein n=1 Tax=Halobacillus massiliensis TaxID=1926286 RepID=UPI0015C49880|nr:YhgE/Pip domain-containing protein [Halobacillus massiliensis]
MKSIWRIFTNDIKNIGTNWVAALLIGGLTLLPSLYAWFNIEASWDPYSQTDQLPVAVVNEDVGGDVRDQDIHVGDELIKQLKNNKKMDWKFVDRKEAMDKVEYGEYFAAIIIPEDFSEKLGTVVSGQPEKAEIEYYVNEKTNAVAPKITETGASTIVDQITSEFISTVNGVIFDLFNDLGLELEKDLPDIKRFENYIFEMEESLPEAHNLLENSLNDANSAQKIIDDAQALIPQAEKTTAQGLQTIDETTAFLTEAENRLNEIEPQVEEDLNRIQEEANNVNEFIQSVQGADIDLSDGERWSQQIDEQVNSSIENIDSIQAALNQLEEQSAESEEEENTEEEESTEDGENPASRPDQEQIDQAQDQLSALKERLEGIQENSGEIRAFLEEEQGEANDLLSSIQQKAETTAEEIDAFVTEYNENIKPVVKEEVNSAQNTLANARSILTEIQTTIPEVEQLLSNTEGNLAEGEKTLDEILKEFPYVNEKVNQLADRIREIQGETDINDIIELLQNDPEAEKGFFAEPVQLNKNSLFAIDNYGTAMTPFYTVLSVWVGCLLLVSLLTTDVHHFGKVSGNQEYFGKLMTFVTIGFLQTIIVTVGDIFVVGASIAEPVWFVLFGLLISLVFMLIVYTLVSVFGDIGKAMAIVMLVLQIAGSGGTYPIALLPEFFQTIHPFLPFSYAIDLMREAVGGIVWERVYRDVIFLSIFGLTALMIGGFLKKPLSRQTKALMKKSRESGLFH